MHRLFAARFPLLHLLLVQGSTAEVLERAEQTLEWGMNGGLGCLSPHRMCRHFGGAYHKALAALILHHPLINRPKHALPIRIQHFNPNAIAKFHK